MVERKSGYAKCKGRTFYLLCALYAMILHTRGRLVSSNYCYARHIGGESSVSSAHAVSRDFVDIDTAHVRVHKCMLSSMFICAQQRYLQLLPNPAHQPISLHLVTTRLCQPVNHDIHSMVPCENT